MHEKSNAKIICTFHKISDVPLQGRGDTMRVHTVRIGIRQSLLPLTSYMNLGTFLRN